MIFLSAISSFSPSLNTKLNKQNVLKMNNEQLKPKKVSKLLIKIKEFRSSRIIKSKSGNLMDDLVISTKITSIKPTSALDQATSTRIEQSEDDGNENQKNCLDEFESLKISLYTKKAIESIMKFK
jgi:hypothetical protein